MPGQRVDEPVANRQDGRQAAAWLWVVLALLGCRVSGVAPVREAGAEDASPIADGGGVGGTQGAGDGGLPSPMVGPDHYWLEKVGGGDAQRAAVCARGRNDLVAQRLCDPHKGIESLAALYTALGLRPGSFNFSIASSSSGLTFRTTSVLNPRAFLSTPRGYENGVPRFDRSRTVVVAFSRGDQLVELVAYDSQADELNFYLLAYRQECNARGCSAEQLLSAATESGWIEWTLYDHSDLPDTPLDCLSCHQPGGPETPRRLLMRDFDSPWFHWLPPSLSLPPCLTDSGFEQPAVHQLPDLRSRFERAHADGYAGQDLASTRESDGHNLHGLVHDFTFALGAAEPPDPFLMDSIAVVREWQCEGTNGVWRAYRTEALEQRGLPVPFYGFDVLDQRAAAPALDDYASYLKGRSAAEVFDLMNGILSDEAQLATGSRVDGSGTPDEILRQSCIRCHDKRAPRGSVRAHFDVEAVTPLAARAALERLALPDDSPFAMPPRRAGSLGAEAKSKVLDHLRALAP